MIALAIPAAGFVLSATASAALLAAGLPAHAGGFGVAALVWLVDLGLVVSR